ncbi:MAG TPA: GDP-mannose 4,6-dehydratase [Flavisolibacter sp.]|jgi:CDP-paratose 2-epimerase
MEKNKRANGKKLEPKGETGLVQWFHLNQYEEVEKTLEDMQRLNITHIRTNVSWADWHSQGGREWYDWLFKTLGNKVEILPCILYTPPSIALKPKSSAPPKNPLDYADFVDLIITNYGQYFEYIELWNEPNNLGEYDYTLDPDWHSFCHMVGAAANWSRQKGKKTVLGGMSPIDPNWLRQMFRNNLMQYIDVVGIHGFPDVFDYNWEGWDAEISKVRQVLEENNSTARLWITEAGYSTWQKNERRQLQEFIAATRADADRMYWYGLNDLSPEKAAVDRFHLDEREYHFGIKRADGSPKLLYTLLSTNDVQSLQRYEWMTEPVSGTSRNDKYILITGGAGFVGINLADRLLSEGNSVLVFDNLSRAGVQKNLFWLKEKYPDNLQIMIADIRDKESIRRAVEGAEQVFHFAAQVAVTSSLVDPYHDFEVNALGTLNLLEAIRNSPHKPPLVFTSTNKVYGDLEDVHMVESDTRYYPEHTSVRQNGISEKRSLDFHSPYGCTKGVADQYILDYARTFGLKTAVFRMSCIYGPHQFGTEDQGWVAHFLIQALKGKLITLYGDGKQVRDILFIEDLVDAFLLTREYMDVISGQAFNIGGGVNNTVSLLELIEMIGEISGQKPQVMFDDWRPSDQKYYVSDFSKYSSITGWKPRNGTMEGVTKLYEWLQENAGLPFKKKSAAKISKTTLQAIDK